MLTNESKQPIGRLLHIIVKDLLKTTTASVPAKTNDITCTERQAHRINLSIGRYEANAHVISVFNLSDNHVKHLSIETVGEP